jgi:hypothetical protein
MKPVSMKQKIGVFAGAALMLVSGMGQSAEAFTFQSGDLILAIYGNRTAGEGAEAIINLTDFTSANSGPSMATLASTPGTTYSFDMSQYLNAPGVKDLNPANPAYPLRYTVLGWSGANYTVGSSDNLTGTDQFNTTSFPTGMIGWSGNVTDANAANLVTTPQVQNGAVVGFGNDNSYTTRAGVEEVMFDSFTNAVMAANLDQLLILVKGETANFSPLVGGGQAKLFADGTFQISGGQLAAVPVPAAVVLFGTGLIGLVGIARRKLFGKAA